MTDTGNVLEEFNKQVMEAQLAVMRAVTPLILEMSTEQRQCRIIGNPNLPHNLGVALALTPVAEPVKPPPTSSLIFFKQTLLGGVSVVVYDLGKRLAFVGMFRTLVKRAGDTALAEVEKLLKQNKHPIPKARAEEMLDKQAKFFLKQEGGEDFGLRGDGWANLILVKNSNGSLSVVDAYWDGYGWRRYRCSLASDDVWPRGDRLVVSNSDTSNL